MTRLLLALGLFALSSITIAADDETEKALKELQGDWQVTKAVSDGEEIPTEFIKTMKFTIKGDKIIPSDKPDDPASIKLNPSKKPAWADFTDKKGTNLGIYELKGEELKLCIAKVKAERPKEFAAPKGTMVEVYLVMKKVKK